MSTYTQFFPVAVSIQNNFAAITAPLATSDSAAGYVVGSVWIDTATNTSYTCVDSTAGAAVWEVTPLQLKSNYAAIVAPAVANDSSQGYSIGSTWIDTVANRSYTAVDVTAGAAIWSAGGIVSSAVAPTPATLGMLWYDSTNKQLMAYNGVAWISQELLNNYAAIVAPAVANDSSQGYTIGSTWVDTVTNIAYTAVDVTAGAAIWDSSPLRTPYKGIAIGTANVVTVASMGAHPETTLTAGMVIYVDFSLTNTGAMTLNLDGLGAFPIVTAAGIALVAGSLKAGVKQVALSFNGGQWVISGSNPMGVGQTWVTVTATRARATTYTNTTGRTITVAVWTTIATQDPAAHAGYATVDGTILLGGGSIPATVAPNNLAISVVVPVPAGSTYSITVTPPTDVITSWSELR